ncbi:major facilitator superfamily domain-containing protein [Trichoderma breve]|uniref:Major facilitator superfamily domain-containing protein n=1 Tax=Trichoderma breve TaxID=2034170 RepID=A0A9W9BKD6_9HYPO|nr:major facilitator superfamily domain-containing protein [Trichoderma breve]KAJ4861331.1 major facilitator superfamily domain-containing protein [Trichoderma breve]
MSHSSDSVHLPNNPLAKDEMDLCLGTSISRYAVQESTESRQGTPTEKSIPPSDIGVMPWIQIAGAFCLMFTSWGIVVSYGTFQQYYTSGGGIVDEASSSTIAWIVSLQAFLLMFGAALTGTLYDAGYFRTMMYCGSFLMVFGLMMTSLANKYWQFILAQSLCTGSGMGLVALGALATPGTWGIIFPIALRHLIPMIGFGWAVRVMGFIVLFMLMLPLSISKQRLPANKRRILIDFKSLGQIEFGLYCLSIFLAFLGFFTFYTFIESWAIATQLNTDGVAPYYILTITNASSSFGRILPNYTADKIGPLNIQVPATLIAGVLVFTWIPAQSMGSVMAIAILYGFFSGSLVSVPPTAIASMTANMNELGGRIGMCFLAMAFGSLIGSPVTGAIVQSVGYDNARIYAGIMLLAGATTMAVLSIRIQ